ncbi:MAG: prolipoprotein diacylglyceryl transferase, partial [Clostridia bacterium]|nr:prolipoprotein diacylglyceryl transferase [Clostridia bacterium]
NFGVYAIAYGIWRFIIEFFRDDDRGGVVGAALTPSQILSIVMVVLGVAFFFLQYYVLSKHMKHPELQQEEIKEEAPAESAQGEI